MDSSQKVENEPSASESQAEEIITAELIDDIPLAPEAPASIHIPPQMGYSTPDNTKDSCDMYPFMTGTQPVVQQNGFNANQTTPIYPYKTKSNWLENAFERFFSWPKFLPVRISEVLSVVIGVILVDFFCFQSTWELVNFQTYSLNNSLPSSVFIFGHTAYAIFLLAMSFLVWISAGDKSFSKTRLFLTILVWIAAAKYCYSGTPKTGLCAFFLLILLAGIGTKSRLGLVETPRYIMDSLLIGGRRIAAYIQSLFSGLLGIKIGGFAEFLFPLLAVITFGVIFILASPDLQRLWVQFSQWLNHFLENLPTIGRVFIWFVAFWTMAGLFAFRTFNSDNQGEEEESDNAQAISLPQINSPYYAVCRNTLVAVSLLFAFYLGHEIRTFIQNDFPEGFDYAAYSHQGAAWLTFALLLSTLTLGLIFQPGLQNDPRADKIRCWAGFWTLENFLLAAAVYYRLWLYIAENGLTSLRVVGLFGTTAVVAGLVCTLYWFQNNKSFSWLINRYAQTVVLLVICYCILPVHAVVHQYNCQRILSGDYAPSLHISHQQIPLEGWLQLFPLLSSDNPVIRDGVAGMIYEKNERLTLIQSKLKTTVGKKNWDTEQWRYYNFVQSEFSKQYAHYQKQLDSFSDSDKREAAISEFKKQSHDWY